MDGLILARWTYRASTDETAVVLPDGCRDLVLAEAPGERPSLFLTALDSAPRTVRVPAGSVLTGLRLRPGARLRADLLRTMGEDERLDLMSGGVDPAAIAAIEPDLEEALQALAAGQDRTGAVAAQLGVSDRTLRRLVVAGTGRPPKWWQRLARARRAVLTLAEPPDPGRTLADIAYALGFADQAHLSRELKLWFGVTPRAVMARPAAADLLQAPGYGSD